MSSKAELLRKHVSRKIHMLHNESVQNSTGDLAQLRKGIGKLPGEIPQLFPLILKDMPEEFYSLTGNPTKEEWAVYIAITTFALHQQGSDIKTDCMHQPDEYQQSVGYALGQLISEPNEADENRLLKRMYAIASAPTIQGTAHHLRGAVQLLKKKGIKLNYVRLASDLYQLQFREGKRQVALRWGQDFYKNNRF